jgi:hypothetical protein
MKIKALKALFVCGLLTLTSSIFAQNVTMSFGNVDIVPGETADLNVTFSSDVTPAGWQMYLYLPTGITIAEEDDDYLIELSNAHHKKHVVDVTEVSDGSMMLVVSGGTKTYEMNATEGDLCTITLKADANFRGSATAEVKKIAIADKTGKQYDMDDVTFTITARQHLTIDLVTLSANEVGFMVDNTFNSENVSGLYVENSEIEPKYVTLYGKRYFVIYNDASKAASLKQKSIFYYYKIGQDGWNLEVALSINEILKSETIIEMDENVSLKATFGEELTAPTVTIREGYDGNISYQSSDENVVKVAADGKLTVVGAGRAVITISGTETTYCNAPADVAYGIDIEKATPTLSTTPAPIANLIYTGQAQALITAGVATAGTLQYSTDGTNYSTNIPQGTAAQEYTVYYKVVGNNNYNDIDTKSFTVTIAKASISPVVTLEGWTYSESAKTPMVKNNLSNGQVTFRYKVKGAADDTYSSTVPTNAGQYTVKAVIAETNNYLGGETTADFTISAKALSKDMVEDIEEQIYSGSAIEPKPVVKDGNSTLKEGTDYTLAYSDNNESGTATITITGKGNYLGTVTIQFIIIKEGDVNGDEQIGVGDLISVSNFMAQGDESGVTLKQADVNGDGEVGVGDLISISNIMAGTE